jgi:hypothetical protein
VKVVAYPKKEKYGSINDTRRPENAELMMIKLLSYFIVNRQTPHLVIPFGTFNTSIDNFLNCVKKDKIEDKNERYKEFIERYESGEFSSNVSILISEWANKGDLLDFFRNNYKMFTPKHWKVILFQILSVLAIIQSKYPSFRHNDMKANNILVHKIEKIKEYHKYVVVRTAYRVPNIGYHVKLWDFDFASIPGIVDNIKVESKWTKRINVTPEQNRYYDVHYFFNTLIRKGFFPQILTDNIVPTEVKEFIGRVVPQKYRNDSKYVHEKGRILINTEHTTPDYLLKNDPYFEEYRINKQGTEKEVKKNKHDLNKLLTSVSEKITIPKNIYNINLSTDDVNLATNNINLATNNINLATNNINLATNNINLATNNINLATNKKVKYSKVEKNIDILKLLENSVNNDNNNRDNSNILEQLDLQLKQVNKLNKQSLK